MRIGRYPIRRRGFVRGCIQSFESAFRSLRISSAASAHSRPSRDRLAPSIGTVSFRRVAYRLAATDTVPFHRARASMSIAERGTWNIPAPSTGGATCASSSSCVGVPIIRATYRPIATTTRRPHPTRRPTAPTTRRRRRNNPAARAVAPPGARVVESLPRRRSTHSAFRTDIARTGRRDSSKRCWLLSCVSYVRGFGLRLARAPRGFLHYTTRELIFPHDGAAVPS